MYAIVEIAGKQYRVEEKRRLRVPLLDVESGKKVEFDKVLVYNDDKIVQIGSPIVNKVKVSATVIEHNREKKIIVFKKKRRKGYKVKNGHRQDYSLILVDKIGAGSIAKPIETKKVETKPKAATSAKSVEKSATSAKAAPKPAAKPKAAPKPKAETKTKTAAKPAVKKATTKPATKTKKAEPKDKKE